MNYTQINDDQRRAMLEAIGVDSIEELFASLPPEHRLGRPLDLPPARSELELRRELAELAAANITADHFPCFMGGGAYDHFIPALVDDVAGRGEFLTAYTPYQAEASQGSLQAFFEFQTQVARLTGMDIANASLYEGANAVAEAAFMAINATGKRRILAASTLHPHHLAVLRTSCADLPAELIELPAGEDGRICPETVRDHLDDDTAAVLVQSPNVYGLIEPWTQQFAAAHEAQRTQAVAVFHPLACALLRTPGDCGADIAAGEGQPLGIPLQYGGPWLGLFAARKKLMRKMPGRLIGQTTDADGRPAYCLTLQTREQHIRGAKATSNVCTNQGLLALRATAYMTAMGPAGLRGVAERCYHKAHYAAARITQLPGYELTHPGAAFFNEFAVNCPAPAQQIVERGRAAGLLPGVPLTKLGIGEENHLLIAVTEKRTRQEIDRLMEVLRSSH